METRCRIAPVLVGAASVVLGGHSASAELINVQPGFPSLFFNATGVTTYDAANDLLTMTGRPIAVRFDPGSAPQFVDVTGPLRSRGIFIGAVVDETGTLVSGVDGDDLRIVGAVDEDDDGYFDYEGVLLTGEIIGFGWNDLDAPGNSAAAALDRPLDHFFRELDQTERHWLREQPTSVQDAVAADLARLRPVELGAALTDVFDLRFSVTGGTLAPLYGNSDIGVVVTSEFSTFAGDFTTDFMGGAKGVVGPLCTLDVVCIAEPVEIPGGGSGSGSSGSHSGSSHSGSSHSGSSHSGSSHSGSSGSGYVLDGLAIDYIVPDDCGVLTIDAFIEIDCDLIPVAAGTLVVLDCVDDGCSSSSGSSGSSHSGSSHSGSSHSGSSHSGSHSGSSGSQPACDWWYEGDVLFIESSFAVLFVTVTDENGQAATCELELCEPGGPTPSGSGSSGSSSHSGSSSGSSGH